MQSRRQQVTLECNNHFGFMYKCVERIVDMDNDATLATVRTWLHCDTFLLTSTLEGTSNFCCSEHSFRSSSILLTSESGISDGADRLTTDSISNMILPMPTDCKSRLSLHHTCEMVRIK